MELTTALVTAAKDRFTYAGIYCGALFLVSGLVSNGITVYNRYCARGSGDAQALAEEADAPGAEKTKCDPEAMPEVEPGVSTLQEKDLEGLGKDLQV